jgi:hypothetical protein
MRVLSLTYVMARPPIILIDQTDPIYRIGGAADRADKVT